MFNIALYEPRIPQNTGNIIRLVANNGCHLHLIEPLGFDLKEKSLRRSGLDYQDLANITQHANYNDFIKAMPDHKVWAITTKGTQHYDQVTYQPGEILLFGSETAGLPADLQQTIPAEQQLRIPMQPNNRSMNLSNTVALVSYEAWRQQGFISGK
ncbi:MAG: tRNA (cytidine/uridine-2'-O-)-methyltransferase [Methyloprofundus sp.]|nr:MAG: tRNA (cytidine/uridine-2'-O-)-methyltransferase [Methyloprofundus sp.]